MVDCRGGMSLDNDYSKGKPGGRRTTQIIYQEYTYVYYSATQVPRMI